MAAVALAFASCTNLTPKEKIIGKWQIVRMSSSSLFSQSEVEEFNNNGGIIEFLENHTITGIDTKADIKMQVWEYNGDTEHITVTGEGLLVPMNGVIIGGKELSLALNLGFAQYTLTFHKIH
jgi:hypothetical protein